MTDSNSNTQQKSVLSEQPNAASNIADIFDWIRSDLTQIDAELKRHLNTDVDFLNDMARHVVMAGGKRMRPSLAVYCGKMCEANMEAIHISAGALEYVHTATLMHDDVVDEATMRRNNTAARLMWGNAPTVLGGDYLLACAFKELTRLGNHEVLETISHATMQMAKGEILQLMRRFDNTDKAEYLRIISYKTACLFAAATKIGAAFGNATDGQKEALYQYGHCLGMAFQITDDVLDYAQASNKLGKAKGADLKERKITLPLSLLLETLEGKALTELKSWLQAESITDDTVEKVSELMASNGIFDSSLNLAKDYSMQALEQLEGFPKTELPYQALCLLADYAVNRDH